VVVKKKKNIEGGPRLDPVMKERKSLEAPGGKKRERKISPLRCRRHSVRESASASWRKKSKITKTVLSKTATFEKCELLEKPKSQQLGREAGDLFVGKCF